MAGGITGGGGLTGWLFGGNKTDPNNAKLEGGSFMRDYIGDQLRGVNGRQAPQADRTRVGNVFQGTGAQITTGPQNQFRDREMSLADHLTRVANGQQQGAGEMAVGRQMRQAAALQQGQAAAQRGGMAGLAGRAAARGLGANSINAAGMSAQAAMGDQQQAQGLLAGVLGQGRGADIGLAQGQAGLNQQMNLSNLDAQNQRVFTQAGLDSSMSLANMQAKLQMQGMNDQASLAYLAQLYGISAAEMQARLAQEGVNAADKGVIGDIMQTGGALGAAAITKSDARLKEGIRDGSADVDAVLDSLSPKLFRYIDQQHGTGEIAGIMAQDLEATPIGAGVVLDMDDGKALDNRKAISLLLATVARLHQRVKQLEGGG